MIFNLGKPKELRKALGGKPHTLSKSDVNSLLKGIEIDY